MTDRLDLSLPEKGGNVPPAADRGCPSRSTWPGQVTAEFACTVVAASGGGRSSTRLGLAARCGWDSRAP